MKLQTLIFIIIFFISITKAIGCTCIAEKKSLKRKVKNEFYSSDIIFTGNAIAIKDLNTHPTRSSSGDPIQYTFEIIKKLKGVDTKRKIQVISTRGGSSCGYTFQIGKTYMVYANTSNYYGTTTENENDYTTSICKRNNHVARVTKKEKRILDRMSTNTSKSAYKL